MESGGNRGFLEDFAGGVGPSTSHFKANKKKAVLRLKMVDET